MNLCLSSTITLSSCCACRRFLVVLPSRSCSVLALPFACPVVCTRPPAVLVPIVLVPKAILVRMKEEERRELLDAVVVVRSIHIG